MESEIWKDIVGYEGIYQVSDSGRIKSYYGRVTYLKHCFNPQGYPIVFLCKNKEKTTHLVHRLLLIHFIPNPLKRNEVNHINGDKSDFSLKNLEWVTRSENIIHADKLGLRSGRKLTESDVIKIKSLTGKYKQCKIAEMFGVHRCTIQSITRKQTWKHLD